VTTATKILAALGVAAAALLGVGLVSYQIAGRIASNLTGLADSTVPGLEALGAVDEGQTGTLAGIRAALERRASLESRRKGLADCRAKLEQVDSYMATFEKLDHGEKVQAHWDNWKTGYFQWRNALYDISLILDQRFAAGAKDDKATQALDDAAWAAYGSAIEGFDATEIAAEELRTETIMEAHDIGQRGDAIAARARTSILTVATAVAVLLAVFGVLLSRSVGRILRKLVREAGRLRDAVAEGRLDVRGDQERMSGELRPVVAGIDAILDAFSRPVKVTAQYVDRIARGDLPPPITDAYQGDFQAVKDNLNRCISTLERLEADSVRLAAALVHGRLLERADAAGHDGAYRRIVEGMNAAVATLIGHLDAVPAPATIVDLDLRVLYMNRAALALGGRTLSEAVGSACRDVICNEDCSTDRCAVSRAIRSGRTESASSVARPRGKQGAVQVDYTGVPILADGKVVGALEVLTDQTAIRTAMRRSEKVAAYQAAETGRVVAALEKLSRGDLAVGVAVEPGDADTAEAREVFRIIAAAIERTAAAVGALTQDVGTLAEAAIAGRLDVRVDAGRHLGDYRAIVQEFDRTLDAMLAPIQEASATLEQLAGRDLRARVSGEYRGDHARIQRAVNATAEALQEALAQVAHAVEQVSDAASQIASSSQSVASGASEQAASLQETTGNVNEVSSVTARAAADAQHANALAQAARQVATEGSAAMEGMQRTVARIRQSAEGTSQIIKDVSEIAFQTNLLALNAAVEAARAGDAGRGFAVVAEEVRSLAQRAKEAATRTEALIKESMKQADEGAGAAKDVAGKLGEIVEGVTEVSAIISRIAESAREQAGGIGQVIRSVEEMDRVTQQNAASAEQSSSAASELSSQAEELAAMVGEFQLGRDEEGRARALPGARRDERRGPGGKATRARS